MRRVWLSGLLLGIALGGVYVYTHQRAEEGLPMYERGAADLLACWVAEAAIAARRGSAKTAFADDCRQPFVTHLSNRPGFVAVTRVVREPDRTAGARRLVFSVLLDGRQPDRWRVVDIRPAPAKVTLDISLLLLDEPETRQEARAADD
jgi:hypothetical protein